MATPSRLPSTRRAAGNGGRTRPMSMFEVPQEHLKKLSQIGDAGNNGAIDIPAQGTTSKQSKRRSLLPTFSRKDSNDRDATGTIREDTSDSEVSSRPTTSEERKASMPPPPKPRPTSMRPPASIPSRTTSVHTRTQSKDITGPSTRSATSSGAAQRTDPALKRTGSTKLPQSPRIGGPNITANQHTIPTRGSSSSTRTASTTAQKRSSALIGKPPVLDTSTAARGSSQTSPTSPTGSTSSRPGARTSIPPPSRPAFSTYQQHYSPAKTSLPKPPVPGVKTSRPSAPTNVSAEPEIAITPELALEQIELLQLSLLHQAASESLDAYETSARRKLGRHHARLCRDYETIRGSEQEYRRIRNLNAIESWCPDHALLAEHLQTLSRVVVDLRAHTEAGSRYTDLVETFDQWATRAEAILLENREPASFIETLSETWRATHTSLALKLRAVQRDLTVLPPAPVGDREEGPSSIELFLTSCSSLVETMLRTLEVMTKLQKEVLQRSKARIDEQINALVADNEQAGDKEKWVPVWESVAS